MASKVPTVVVEIGTTFDKASNVSDVVGAAAMATQVITLSAAFQKYSWLHLKPIMNVSGNLRGIVINARARSVYEFAVKGEKVANSVGAFAAIVVSLASVYGESVAIMESNDDGTTKGAKMSSQVASAALRAITGMVVVPEVTMLSNSISWAARNVEPWFPAQQTGLQNISQFAGDYANNVTAKFQSITDGNNIYNYIQTTIDPGISKFFGL
ncbi:MAG TPA: hypothetical protein VFC37_22290 [Terracidiphilus sp.]|nr:hypothetical protein [Terracidiphilus sp.]